MLLRDSFPDLPVLAPIEAKLTKDRVLVPLNEGNAGLTRSDAASTDARVPIVQRPIAA